MHDEPKHQHAWLPLHKPPTHGKDLALLLMVVLRSESLNVERLPRSAAAAASLVPNLKRHQLLLPSPMRLRAPLPIFEHCRCRRI